MQKLKNFTHFIFHGVLIFIVVFWFSSFSKIHTISKELYEIIPHQNIYHISESNNSNHHAKLIGFFPSLILKTSYFFYFLFASILITSLIHLVICLFPFKKSSSPYAIFLCQFSLILISYMAIEILFYGLPLEVSHSNILILITGFLCTFQIQVFNKKITNREINHNQIQNLFHSLLILLSCIFLHHNHNNWISIVVNLIILIALKKKKDRISHASLTQKQNLYKGLSLISFTLFFLLNK